MVAILFSHVAKTPNTLYLQTILTIENIIAQVQNSHKISKRNFDSIRNECRQSLQQGVEKENFKKMAEEVMKAHKQCTADIISAKKFGEEISEEIAQGTSKLGERKIKALSRCAKNIQIENLNAQSMIMNSL